MMASEKALEQAAQLWTLPTTSMKVLDNDLSQAFASLIDTYRDALTMIANLTDGHPVDAQRRDRIHFLALRALK